MICFLAHILLAFVAVQRVSLVHGRPGSAVESVVAYSLAVVSYEHPVSAARAAHHANATDGLGPGQHEPLVLSFNAHTFALLCPAILTFLDVPVEPEVNISLSIGQSVKCW